jgi:hypothetical protein
MLEHSLWIGGNFLFKVSFAWAMEQSYPTMWSRLAPEITVSLNFLYLNN